MKTAVFAFCAAVLCVCLFSCGHAENELQPPVEIAETTVEAEAESRESVTEPSAVVSRAEVDVLVENFERYRVLLHDSNGVDVDFSAADDSGQYFLVTSPEYAAWADWVSFVSSVFCGAYLDERLAENENFKNIDGFTYCRPGSMGNPYILRAYDVRTVDGVPYLDITYADVGSGAETTVVYRCLLRETDEGWRVAGQTLYGDEP